MNEGKIENKKEFKEDDFAAPPEIIANVTHLLLVRFGVDKLSIIEGSTLSRIVREVIKDGVKHYNQVIDGEAHDISSFDWVWESIARWFYDLYGYKLDDIPSTYLIDGFIKANNRLELDLKLKELLQQGKSNPTIKMLPTEEFKEYFKRVRERAHRP